ncbi:hypothetical protein NMY22_g19721 [Coprinellus aureogranulatus]|nr:hypothetical protein NMY22_g19721 [Coprinellus aureogranulatus]
MTHLPAQPLLALNLAEIGAYGSGSESQHGVQPGNEAASAFLPSYHLLNSPQLVIWVPGGPVHAQTLANWGLRAIDET